MELNVSLQDFSGPLDLLLELVRQHRYDLFNLDMRSLADQYSNYVSKQIKNKHAHLDEIADYLLMAAYLFAIKAKWLLPKPEEDLVDSSDDLERDLLVNRLIEHDRYRAVTPALLEMIAARGAMHDRQRSNPADFGPIGPAPLPDHVAPLALLKALQRVMRHQQIDYDQPQEISVTELSAELIKEQLLAHLRANDQGKSTLTAFIASVDRSQLSVRYFVVAFVAMLDMVRQHWIMVNQGDSGEIELAYVPEDRREAW